LRSVFRSACLVVLVLGLVRVADAGNHGRQRPRVRRDVRLARTAVRAAPVLYPELVDAHADDVPEQTAMQLVSADSILLPLLATGDGVKIAALDGGFDLRHEYLNGHLGSQWDAIDQDNNAQELADGVDDDADGLVDFAAGHGTFVAGILATCAPDATILPIRVLDEEGNGSAAALARGIDKAVEFDADVINMSLVCTVMTTQLEVSIQNAIDAGVVIVIAAGDEVNGPFSAQYLRDRAIVVGAVTDNLQVASFSPNESLVHVFAPGVEVLGPIGGGSVGNTYGTWSGTSFSTPFVAAAAALVKELAPSTTNSPMRTLLMAAVNPVSNAVPSGRGSIDLLEAVTNL
jgi:subtilisin family serine protease